jgi:hypothetical protein
LGGYWSQRRVATRPRGTTTPPCAVAVRHSTPGYRTIRQWRRRWTRRPSRPHTSRRTATRCRAVAKLRRWRSGGSGCEAAAQAELETFEGRGAAQFDPSTGAQCIAGLKWFGEVCPVMGAIAVLGPAMICGGVYVGTLPAGAPCSSRTQCQPPEGGTAMCLPIVAGGPSVCVTVTSDRGPGETCTRYSEATAEYRGCVEGYECDEAIGVCKAECRGGLGANCQSQACAAGLRCDLGTYRCVAVSVPGGPCSSDLDCWDTCSDGVCRIELSAKSCYSGR